MNAPTTPVRIVTAASLFDGHDAAINIMRRILQSKGAEIIHLGHNRSVHEIAECAIEEDAHAIAITSYQGGHVEFFKYLKDLLEESGCGHIKIFGGGGGTILPSEIEELHAYGITRIYSPDDGRRMGLEGMIEDVIGKAMADSLTPGPSPEERGVANGEAQPQSGFWDAPNQWNGKLPLGETKDIRRIARQITEAEQEGNFANRQMGNEQGAKGNGQEATGKRSEPGAVAPGQKATGNEQRGSDNDTNNSNASNLSNDSNLQPPTSNLQPPTPVLGITGTGGAGKSSVTDEILRRFLAAFPEKKIAIVSVDPSKKKTGGALLGDRIRMNAVSSPRVYMRSLATRDSEVALSAHVPQAIAVCKRAGFDLIILESAGVGQSDASILDYCDVSLYVMTPEYGAASQLEKINMLDYADVIAINKFDKAGALDALADVRKQYKRNHALWTAKDEELPIVGTIAAQFNDAGVNALFARLMEKLAAKTEFENVLSGTPIVGASSTKTSVIPAKRVRYLSEISDANRAYNGWVEAQAAVATKLYQIAGLEEEKGLNATELQALKSSYEARLHPDCKRLMERWQEVLKKYAGDAFEYKVRDKIIRQPLITTSLSGTRIPKVVLPKYKDWGDLLRWQLQEGLPGEFPYTAGVFELKRTGEDPTRMFAGEGGPERTNRRFHYVSEGQPAKRLSTAFDSVTLYGEDPAPRPDIWGKVGNAGVSIATVDDAKKLYSGFDLCDPLTSVSMTINGPAPMLLAFFMNSAIDQHCEKYIVANGLQEEVNRRIEEQFDIDALPFYLNSEGEKVVSRRGEMQGALPPGNNGLGLRLLGLSGADVLPEDMYGKLRAEALAQVRGTVQADILKEDQAQNTCIFSTEFALKLMGDVQEYFIEHGIRNFYSVSISGYHIAEAGANPVTQLAFTLANGFTYVEYYLSRGMAIDDFAPNLSFFFSNGMDPEYSVIGRVARRIWAKAMKEKYGANERSQKLKYHIQTSGRSLHAQEIDFNDIRTTLQALYAIYDNCNSLHTNAYDEAITTPTEESVRRAMAIQLIINRELGSAKTENYIQGSFAVEELTDLVEEAVLLEFDRLTERGGVLGAMERMYQRNKIQEESMVYEHQKHTGELPLIGVNTFLSKTGSPTILPTEVIRSTEAEKEQQIQNLQAFQQRNKDRSEASLQRLKEVAIANGNLFAELMETVRYCSLGQITQALYEVGGQYRRSM